MTKIIPPDVDDDCLCLGVQQASRVLTHIYNNYLTAANLKITQFCVLRLLKHLGETNAKQISMMLTLDQSTLSRSLSLLTREGLIANFTDEDQREKRLKLTHEGELRLHKARQQWKQAQEHVLQLLGPDIRTSIFQVGSAIVDLRR